MKLIAHTFDGMRTHRATKVTAIHIWINKICKHPVNNDTINALINKAQETKQMQIYAGSFNTGEIDAYDGNYLSIYGAAPVAWLELDGNIIYRQWDGIENLPCHKTMPIYN